MQRGSTVDVTWDLWSDEPLESFTLYRRHNESPQVAIASGEVETTRSYVDRSVDLGETYHYELVIHTMGGDGFRSPVATVTVARLVTSLGQNYPNPFNPRTTISFTLPKAEAVTLAVFDIEGRLVSTLVDEAASAGENAAQWDGRDELGRSVASGIYFYRLQSGTEVRTRKMVLLK